MPASGERVVTVHLVAHTHWDREWYHGEEWFQHRLVTLVDELLDDPPPTGEGFLLDGQAIVLDDYLRVRPERAAELSRLLQENRLEAGPWYVLADGVIPSAEALVRNLTLGRDTLRRLRGEPPPVLYCPDAFGHPAVLPDLAEGFGCEVVVVWRGYGGSRWPQGDTVRWRGPGGSLVLLAHLAPAGYELGCSLPHEVNEARDRWRTLADVLLPRASTAVVLLPNGADHHARQREQREAVQALADVARPHRVRHSTLRGWASALAEAARSAPLPEVRGELRDSYGYTWTLGGTLGSRTAQKRENAGVERLLVRDVEPWVAMTAMGGSASSRALLREGWRTLLGGHPHDTLCGTAIDSVADALDHRLRSARAHAESLREEALHALIGHDRERARERPAGWTPTLLLRNPVARRRSGVAHLVLTTTIADVAVGPGSASRQGVPRETPPAEVDGMLIQRLSSSEHVALVESPRAYPHAARVRDERALGWVREMGGYAVETRAQNDGTPEALPDAPPHTVRVDAHRMENGLLAVEVDGSGIVTLRDIVTNAVVRDAVQLEMARDAGDLYTPAIREPASPPTLRSVRVTLAGPLRGEMTVEFGVRDAEGTIVGQASVALVLDAGLSAMRVILSGDIAARDSRLRIRFATGLAGERTIADAAFHPVERAPIAVDTEDERMEAVVRTAPLHRWVSRYTHDRGVTIISDGLAEYEALDDGTIAVTLVRSVGVLSRHDLPERPGHAGWPVDTPGAQSPGPFEAAFALALHGPDSTDTRDLVERLADDVLLPITGETLRSNLDEPHAAGGVELIGDGLAFSAMLPAREPGWIVLRCVNRRETAVHGRWVLARDISDATYARLDETPKAALSANSREVAFEAAPHAIVTILVR